MSNKFLFNDYASRDGDAGVDYDWDLGEGRIVPIHIHKSLGIRERRKASEAATKMSFDHMGVPKVEGFDDATYSLIIAEAVIVDWPFEEADGTPTPINRANLEALPSFAVDELSAKYQNIKKAQVEAQAPFESKSAVVSSPREQTVES